MEKSRVVFDKSLDLCTAVQNQGSGRPLQPQRRVNRQVGFLDTHQKPGQTAPGKRSAIVPGLIRVDLTHVAVTSP